MSLIADWEKCTGCRTCTFVCSFYHHRIFSPSTSRIHIIKQEEKGVNIPIICEHCENPPCVAACPEEALKMDEKGFVSYQEDLCTFCGICAASCPYNYLAIGKLKGKEILLKCDLCNGDPQCVRYCTPEALQLVERTPDQEARKNMLTKHRMAKLREVL